MSILSSLYHHEIHNKPNDVHNVVGGDTKEFDRNAVLTAEAKRRKAAMIEGSLRPMMTYSQEEELLNQYGELWQTPHTVASKLEAKEEFPLG